MAWIASIEHDEAKSVRPLAWCGDEGYIAKANITWADTERGRGPAGLAARTGKTHFFQDFASDPPQPHGEKQRCHKAIVRVLPSP